MESIRATALSAGSALNETLTFLNGVQSAVRLARDSSKPDSQVTDEAVAAIQHALNASATSQLAMKLTSHALEAAASEQTSELLGMLRRVQHNMEEARGMPKSQVSFRVRVQEEGGHAQSNTIDVDVYYLLIGYLLIGYLG